jgi:hypothetical protein
MYTYLNSLFEFEIAEGGKVRTPGELRDHILCQVNITGG